MFLIGLTGGIATGKSSVANIIKNMGIEIIDSDIIAREVVEPGKKAWKRIRKEFGESVFHADGTLNRPALAHIVFSQPEKRQLLNSITHPEVYKTILYRYIKLFFRGHQFAVVDVPLLYESGKMVKYLHKSIVVVCDSSQQLERLMKRNNFSEQEAIARITAQMPLSEKAKLADFVVSNNSDLQNTQQQVETIIHELKRSKAHWKYRLVFFGCIALTVTAVAVGPYLLYLHLKKIT